MRKLEPKNYLELQAKWQKSRRLESWTEKLTKSALARDSLHGLRSAALKSKN